MFRASDAGFAWSGEAIPQTGVATTTSVTANPTTAYTTSPSSVVTITATVFSGGQGVTGGTVQFYDNGSAISGPAAVSGGVAQVNTSFSSEGVHRLTATYSGTASYLTSNNDSDPVQIFVDKHTTVSGGTFCNTSTIRLTASSSEADVTTPYPQHVYVSGLSGGLASATLRLNNITQTGTSFLSDLDFLLVSPSGKAFVPMAQIGADSLVSGLTLTLADSGATPLPRGTNPAAGTYQAGDYNPTLSFPGAGSTVLDSPPAGDYYFPTNQGSSTFDGTFASENLANATAPWSLYVASRNTGDNTTIGGYCLAFVTNGNTPTTTVLSASANPAVANSSVTLTAHVTANGANVTSGTVTFSSGLTQLATESLDANGDAIYAVTFGEGTYALTAQYSGVQGSYNLSSGSTSLEVDNPTTVTDLGTNAYSFCNAGPIDIPATGVPLQYPSRVFITGLAGTIQTLDVSVDGVTYPTPHDLEMMLLGPGGATNNLVFWGNAGSDTAGALDNQNFIFEDGATPLPASVSLVSGTYSPGAYAGSPSLSFPAPAPLSSSLQYAQTLGTATFAEEFTGEAPNGTYEFFIDHNVTGSTGTVGAHCLGLTINPPVLTLSKTHTGSFTQGDTADTYTITVANPSGPGSTAGPLTLADTLPSGLTPVSMGQTGGGSNWNCDAPNASCTRSAPMAPGETDTITLTVAVAGNAPTGTNAVTNHVSVSGGGAATQTASDPTTILIAPATMLVFTQAPAAIIATGASPGAISVAFENAADATVTTDTGNVTLTVTGPGNYLQTYMVAAVNGVATFNPAALSAPGSYTYTATSLSVSQAQASQVADAYGATGNFIWVGNMNGTADVFDNTGAPKYELGSANSTLGASGLAVNNLYDVWVAAYGSARLAEYSGIGTVLAPPDETAAGVSAPVAVAIDGLEKVWIVDGSGSLSVLTNGGGAFSPSSGYAADYLNHPAAISIDTSGFVWVANAGSNSVTEILGGGAPVTPLSQGVANGSPGSQP